VVRRAAILLALVALVDASAVAAQGWRPVWRVRTFTPRDGLPHHIVRDVLEARDGSLWFATMAGVARLPPGACRFERFGEGESRSEAMAIAEDAEGAIWIATQGGGIGRHLRGAWRWYTRQDGLPSDEVSSLLVDSKGRLWATPTSGGVARLEGDRFRTYGPGDGLDRGEIGRCAETRAGTILCGTYDRPVLQRFSGGRWSQLHVDAPAGRHFYVHALIEARDGRLWLGTKGAGAIEGERTPEGGYRWTVHDVSAGPGSNRVGAVREARDGSIWLATSSGASRFDPRRRRWTTLGRRDGLGSNQVFAVLESRDGATWIATLGGGVARYARSGWETLGESEGLASDNVTGGLLRTRDGRIWVGTDRGISVLAAGTLALAERIQTGAFPTDYVNHLLEARDGSVWVATRGGVRRFQRGAWQELPALAGAAHRLAEGKDGRIWIAGAAGVRATRDGSHAESHGPAQGLPPRPVNDVLIDRGGKVWAATDDGVARLDGARWTQFLSPGPARRTNRIHSLALDGAGRLWASGLDGVNRLGEKDWERVPPSSWLPAGIYSRFLMSTADGSLWFAVRGIGVRRLHGDRWSSYTSGDGLASDTMSDVRLVPDAAAARPAARGRFLFATLGGGLSCYRPERDPPETLVGAGPDADGAPLSALEGEALVIGYRGQDLLNESEPRSLQFSHRLDGGAWSPFSTATRARLTGLRPGAHLFEVRAMDQDLNVDASPAAHRFRVVRPWWREPWILGLLALTLALALYAALRVARAVRRERRAIEEEQATLGERRQFVRLASHELRKPLARIGHRAEMLALLEDPAKVREYASALAKDSRDLAKLVETLLEHARVQEVGRLELQLERGDVRELCAQVRAEFAQDPAAAAVELHGETRLEAAHDRFFLRLALRNLVDNALKYGGGRVEVALSRERGRAVVRVRDHGAGIPPGERERVFDAFFRGASRAAAEHGGFGLGLAFARDIARAHGGELVLEPAREGERGACFRLELPGDGTTS
jgi:signal transduction histidine kinase/ligand-binding sensor domain-containing protein